MQEYLSSITYYQEFSSELLNFINEMSIQLAMPQNKDAQCLSLKSITLKMVLFCGRVSSSASHTNMVATINIFKYELFFISYFDNSSRNVINNIATVIG